MLVPYGEQGKVLMDELEQMQAPDFRFLRKIQRYSVNLYDHALRQAVLEGLVVRHPILQLHYVPAIEGANIIYDNWLGLVLDGQYTVKLGATDAFIC